MHPPMASTRRFLTNKTLTGTRPCLVGVGFLSSRLQVWIRYLLLIHHANRTHAFCEGKSRAGNTPAFDLPVESFRPCSLDIAMLNGQISFIYSGITMVNAIRNEL